MKKYLIKIPQILFLISILILIGFTNGKLFNQEISSSTSKEQNIPDSLEMIVPHFPDCSFDKDGNELIVYNSDGTFRARLLFTQPICKHIKGYGGNIPFIIVLSKNNKVEKLILLPNNETPNWIESLKMQGFFDAWNGLNVEESLNKKVDAVTGSTYTSNAVIESMQVRLAEYSQSIKKKRVIDSKKLILNIFSGLVILFALLSFFFTKKFKKYRIILLISEIVLLGFLSAEFLSLALINYIVLNGLSIYSRWVIVLILLFSVLLPLITNKSFYCQYLCPFGAFQELACMLPVKKIKIGKRTSKILKRIKYFYLIIIAFLTIAGVSLVLESFEPFMAFKFQYASWISITIAVVFIVLSIFIKKPWCNYFCPTGALLEMLRKPLKMLSSNNKTNKLENNE
ncbi:MAG TPA: 4Fe-4S binding protein [Bacteroidales bacterium]|nr:4Fe-4S binding protein [Bacteroidales bacterium]